MNATQAKRMVESIRWTERQPKTIPADAVGPYENRHRLAVAKISGPIEGQLGRYNAKTFSNPSYPAPTTDFSESDLGSLAGTDNAVVWNLSELADNGNSLVNDKVVMGWLFQHGDGTNKPVIVIPPDDDTDTTYDADELWIHEDAGPEEFGESAIFQHVGPVGDGDDPDHDERKAWQPVELTDNGDGSFTITLHGPKELGEGAIEGQAKAVFDSRGHLSEDDTLDGTASITIPANPEVPVYTLDVTKTEIEYVTNVECIDGEIVVTKTTTNVVTDVILNSS